MQSFVQYTPTKVVFGKDTQKEAGKLVSELGITKVFLVYGGGSVIRSGLLDEIKKSLDEEHISYEELGGVKPNPRLSFARKGVEKAIAFGAELILAVGGGSAIDTAKGIAIGAANPGTDIWEFWKNKKELKKLETDKFSVLDQIRKIDYGNNLPVTISMGIGIDGDTINENLKLATGALDLALGRGGDQAVIKTKDKFAFYGGKSKAVEKTTKVKSRLIGHALREVILESDHVFIMGHKYPDMDAMGAAVGIYDICKSCNKTANIVLDHSNESIEEFIKKIKRSDYHDGIFVDCDYAIRECMKNTLVVVVDTHRPNFTECPQLLEISDKVVVIDHHRRGVDFINDTVLLFHEIYVSSTCEMVTELVQYIEDDVRINKLTAEGLLAGISLDTKNFAFKTGVRTFEAASYLKKSGADTIEVKKLFNSDIKDFITKAEIIQNAKVINNNICLAYTKTETDNINIVIAQAADELLNIKEVEASFVLARKDDRVFISARSLGNINVHVLMENLGGGGHRDMAGAQLDTSLEKAYEMVKDTIQTCIKEEE